MHLFELIASLGNLRSVDNIWCYIFVLDGSRHKQIIFSCKLEIFLSMGDWSWLVNLLVDRKRLRVRMQIFVIMLSQCKRSAGTFSVVKYIHEV